MPVYDWSMAERSEFFIDKHKEALEKRNVAQSSYILRTDDIINHELDLQKRMKNAGVRDETYDCLKTSDIENKPHPQRERKPDFMQGHEFCGHENVSRPKV